MTMDFDPYSKWLGIPPERRPPTYYDLLGIALYESDPVKIEQAALWRIGKVRQYQIGPRSDLSQQVLGELTRARLVLIDADRRADYDAKLRDNSNFGPVPTQRTAATPAGTPEPTGVAPKAEHRNDREKQPADAGAEVFGSLILNEPGQGAAFALQPEPQQRLSADQLRVARRSAYVLAAAAIVVVFLGGFWAFSKIRGRVVKKPAVAIIVESTDSMSAPSSEAEETRARPDLFPPAMPPPAPTPPPTASISRRVTTTSRISTPPAEAPKPRMSVEPEKPRPEPAKSPAGAKSGDTVAAAPKSAESSPPELILKSHNLKREGRYVVHDDEAIFAPKLAAAKDEYRKFLEARDSVLKIQQHFEGIAELDASTTLLRNSINARQNQLNAMRTPNNQARQARQALQAELNYDRQVQATQNNQLAALRGVNVSQKDRDSALSDAERAFTAAREKVTEVRQWVETLKSAYQDLAKDEDVSKAITAQGEAAGATGLKLGPSDKFQNRVKDLAALEKLTQTKPPAPARSTKSATKKAK
jgi:hypothetical protein